MTPGAFYNLQVNQMFTPYSALDGWWFDNERPQILNIATLSSPVAHEITHGFDSVGSFFDHEGLNSRLIIFKYHS